MLASVIVFFESVLLGWCIYPHRALEPHKNSACLADAISVGCHGFVHPKKDSLALTYNARALHQHRPSVNHSSKC